MLTSAINTNYIKVYKIYPRERAACRTRTERLSGTLPVVKSRQSRSTRERFCPARLEPRRLPAPLASHGTSATPLPECRIEKSRPTHHAVGASHTRSTYYLPVLSRRLALLTGRLSCPRHTRHICGLTTEANVRFRRPFTVSSFEPSVAVFFGCQLAGPYGRHHRASPCVQSS